MTLNTDYFRKKMQAQKNIFSGTNGQDIVCQSKYLWYTVHQCNVNLVIQKGKGKAVYIPFPSTQT